MDNEPLELPDAGDHEKEKIERLRRAMYSRQLQSRLDVRPRRELQPERPAVGEDWRRVEEGAPGSLVAPLGINIARRVLQALLVLSAVFFIGAAAYFGYFFAFGGGSLRASSQNIDIAIGGPLQIAGGEKTELQIIVTNRNNVPLQLADLVITYPEGTRSPVDLISSLPNQRISLGAIEPGGRRQGTVTAVFAGNAGDHTTIKVELEYRLGNSTSIFVADSDYTAQFGSAPVSVAVVGNTQAISGQPLQLNVVVSSNASVPVRDVVLRADLPFGFKLTDVRPAQSAPGAWALGDLSPGQRINLTLEGTLTGQSAEERIFRFTTGTASSSSATSTIGTVMSTAMLKTEIAKPFLDLVMSVEGQDVGSGIIVAPGDSVTVNVAYQNNLDTEITNAVIVGRFAGLEIDGATVRTSDGFYRSTDGSLLWDRTTTAGDLARIAPGGRGTLTFTFQVPKLELPPGSALPHIDISLSAAGTRVGESGVPQTLQSTARQRLAVGSDVQLTAQGLYYASPFGAVGPLPPQAGKETAYALVFTIKNTTSEITDATLTAQLPPYVRWIGTRSPASEQVSLNQETGIITWHIGTIATGTGTGSSTPRQLALALGLTPSTSQIGEQPVLVRNITLKGTDAATGEVIKRTTRPDVTTNLTQIGRSSDAATSGVDPGFNPASATVQPAQAQLPPAPESATTTQPAAQQ
jgi:hypothetical protein